MSDRRENDPREVRKGAAPLDDAGPNPPYAEPDLSGLPARTDGFVGVLRAEARWVRSEAFKTISGNLWATLANIATNLEYAADLLEARAHPTPR